MSENSLSFPPHSCGLYLDHNIHKNLYEDPRQWIIENELYDWENEEQKELAIKTNEIWTLQWYPDTPIGFHAVAAPTLFDLLRIANSNV